MGINKEFLTPTPHPDYQSFTLSEIKADLERIESDWSGLFGQFRDIVAPCTEAPLDELSEKQERKR